MPTYDYKCEKCGHAMEAFQPMSAAPLKKCPECGKNALKRLIGAGAGLIFRGSGFYCTDYRKGSAHDSAAKPADKPSGGNGNGNGGACANCPNKPAGGTPGASGGSCGGGAAKE